MGGFAAPGTLTPDANVIAGRTICFQLASGVLNCSK